MRVIHVITRLIVGGAQENTIASVLGLRKIPGLEAQLISGPSYGPEGSLESKVESLGASFVLLPELVRPISPWKDWVALKKLTQRFRVEKPDIVHTHSGKAGLLGRAAAARAGVPIIIHTIHGPSFGTFLNPMGNVMFRRAEKWGGHRTTHFVVVAEAMKAQYLAAGIGTPEQYTRVFSGFDLEPFVSAKRDLELRRRLSIQPQDIVVGKVARLFKLKGHDDLLDIAPKLVSALPQLKFLLVGDGEWRGRLEQRVNALGLEKSFIFTGLVNPREIPSYVGICDMVVHLSQREGLARALPQAMAAGLPIVAYECDGAPEVCIEGETGFLIPVGDQQLLMERILLLARDSELRKQLGQRGQVFVLSRFSTEAMVSDLHRLYLKLMENHGAQRSETLATASRK